MVADDDVAIRRYLVRRLAPAGFVVLGIEPERLSPEEVRRLAPDALVVGSAVSGNSGIGRLVEAARGAISDIAIIALLDTQHPRATIDAFDSGASDCLVKPFSLGELAARLRKALRQRLLKYVPWPVLRAGDLEIDLIRGNVRRSRRNIALTRPEYHLLRQLLEEGGNVVSVRLALAEIWGTEDLHSASRVHQTVQSLRAKLKLGGKRAPAIVAEPRIGYRLQLTNPTPTEARAPDGTRWAEREAAS